MSHRHPQSSYRVYVLRSWFEGGGSPGEPPVRRYSLEDPQTRQRRGFADLQALIRFLAAEEEREAPPGGEPPDHRKEGK